MKGKILRPVIIILIIVAVCALLFSIFWPIFHKKVEASQIQTVSIKTPDNNFTSSSIQSSNTSSERILCVDDNLDALLWRLKIINSAENKLDFVTFSFNDDRSGRDIMSALYNAASRGVKVRMVVDGLSSFLYLKNSNYFNTLANNKNIEVKVYNPIKLLKPWRINYRMHDKYIIADNNLYILGGRNTKNLSLGNYQEKKDIDRDVVVYNPQPFEGDSLNQVENYFENIWQAKCTKDYKAKKIKAGKNTVKANGKKGKLSNEEAIIKSQENLMAYYNNLKDDFPLTFEKINWLEETFPVNSITLFHNPINDGNKAPTLWASLINLIKQGKDIIIQTPYIMCNKMMYDDLTDINNGRNVKIITNSVENGANICGCADYLNQKKKIMKTGARIYECNGEHSSHAKTILIDDNISVIGSFNCDMRSAYIDTELMLVIDSPELNSYLRGLNDTNISQSRCVYPDGKITYGDNYKDKKLTAGKKALYGFLRVVTEPVRYLL